LAKNLDDPLPAEVRNARPQVPIFSVFLQYLPQQALNPVAGQGVAVGRFPVGRWGCRGLLGIGHRTTPCSCVLPSRPSAPSASSFLAATLLSTQGGRKQGKTISPDISGSLL